MNSAKKLDHQTFDDLNQKLRCLEKEKYVWKVILKLSQIPQNNILVVKEIIPILNVPLIRSKTYSVYAIFSKNTI